jgi:succinate-semialdehyde dehydrogenase/glutarate-semialdehyde dehydrogenase
MYQQAHLYIDGAAIAETASARFDVINPATEEVLGSAPSAGPAEVTAAIEAAQRGFQMWRRTAPFERAQKLRRVGALIRERLEELATLVTLEIGKTLAESRIEVTACAEYFEWAAEEARRLGGYFRTGRTPDSRFEVSHEPIGVVLALAAWNYPVILASRKISLALAAGCSVIVRPAEEGPSCVAALIRCCHDAGIPAGVVNLLLGSPEAVVEPLMASPIVRAVSFTGSTRVGQLLVQQSAQTVKRVTMELGGHAPFIVLTDADIDNAAAAAVTARMRCAGQVCSAPSRFFVEEAVSKSFTEQMVKLSQALTVGNGLEQGVQMGPLATSRQLQRAQRLVADARAKGARVVCGGGRPRGSNQGYFFEPTILTDVPPDAAIMHEEPFTPIAAIVAVSSAQEAVARANEVEFGLAAYVFSRSGNAIDQMTAQLEAGVIGVNTVAVALPEAPFGGVKHSGYGREGGVEGIHDFVNTKFVHRFRS